MVLNDSILYKKIDLESKRLTKRGGGGLGGLSRQSLLKGPFFATLPYWLFLSLEALTGPGEFFSDFLRGVPQSEF